MKTSFLVLSVGLMILPFRFEVVKTNLLSNNKIVSVSEADFVNSIVSGGKCNTFGYDHYVQNSDTKSAYTVTVRVDQTKPGSPSSQFQKILDVPAGGKTYAGCSVSPETGGPSYTYTVIGETKK